MCWSELCSFYNIFASSSLLHFGGVLIDDERVAGSSSANCKWDDGFCKVPTLCADACLCTQISSVQWRNVSRSFVCSGSKLMWFRNWQTLNPVCWLWFYYILEFSIVRLNIYEKNLQYLYWRRSKTHTSNAADSWKAYYWNNRVQKLAEGTKRLHREREREWCRRLIKHTAWRRCCHQSRIAKNLRFIKPITIGAASQKTRIGQRRSGKKGQSSLLWP